jgi:hypothetical protein
MWRRKIHQGKSPSMADASHFHSLIYRRVTRWPALNKKEMRGLYSQNAKTSHYLWCLSILTALPAIVWWDSTWILQCFTLLFAITYIVIYKALIKFKTPKFFKLLKKL